jgi:hypothetical protein
MRLVVLAALVSLSLACAANTTVPFRPEPVIAPAGVGDQDLYTASIRVFTDQGYSIQMADETAGVIATNLLAIKRVGDRHVFYGWRATIGDGTLKISIDCRVGLKSGAMTACNDKREDRFVAYLPRLREAIFAEAQQRAARRGQ